MFNYKKLTAAVLTSTFIMYSVTGCANSAASAPTQAQTDESSKTSFTSTQGLTVNYTKEELDDTFKESDCTKISLGNEMVEITSPGTYLLSGTLTENSIHVNCSKKDTVRLILNGVNITNSSAAPIFVEEAQEVIITLAEGTKNTITDLRNTTAQEDYSGALSSKADLAVNGKGTLTINTDYRNGIKSSDDLKIVSGTFYINSKEDGMIGKDLLAIKDGNYTIVAGMDGMKSTYDTDTSKGNIVIENGQFQITSQNDGIQSQNILAVNGGTFEIKTGTGASNALKSNSTNSRNQFDWGNRTTSDDSESNKGLKSANATYITAGTYTIDSQDDSIHSNGQIVIDNGTFYLSAGDDGIHADSSIDINGGTIDIQKSYEGIEAEKITVNQGDISIVSSDDGINAANGSGSSTEFARGGMKDGKQGFTENTSSNNTSSNAVELTINGGTLLVNADGDGIDSNGNVFVNDGEIVVIGPTNDGNAALDFDNQFEINGGTLMAFGSSGMLETPTSATNGCCLAAAFETQTANAAFELNDASGNTILKYTPVKSYSSAIVYSKEITSSNQYTMKAGNASVELTAQEGVTTNGNVGMGKNPGMFGGGRGGRDMENNNGMPDGMEMPNIEEMPDGMEMPNMGEMPDGNRMPENQGNGMPDADGSNEFPNRNHMKQDGGQKGQSNTDTSVDTQKNQNFM